MVLFLFLTNNRGETRRVFLLIGIKNRQLIWKGCDRMGHKDDVLMDEKGVL